MTRRLLALAAALLLAAPIPGYGAGGALKDQLAALKNDFNLQLALLQRQTQFLEKKSAQIEAKIANAEAGDRQLSHDMAIFVARPEQVKKELVDEVGARSDSAGSAQETYAASLRSRLGARDLELNRRLDAEAAHIGQVLSDEGRFYRFVFTEQDSINRAFAARFDTRPWYQSVLGRWESRKPTE